MPDPLPPVEPVGEVARRNVILGWVLFGVAVVIFAGSIGIAFIYLAYD
jgi:hypothetical protein